MRITKELLDTVQVLYVDPELGTLWGVPYDMREGQAPTDIWNGRTMPDPMHPPPVYLGYTVPDPGPQKDWIPLKPCPGASGEEEKLIKDFLDPIKDAGWRPNWYREWTTRKDWESENDERQGETDT